MQVTTVNSLFNPILYFWRIKSMRKNLVKLFTFDSGCRFSRKAIISRLKTNKKAAAAAATQKTTVQKAMPAPALATAAAIDQLRAADESSAVIEHVTNL